MKGPRLGQKQPESGRVKQRPQKRCDPVCWFVLYEERKGGRVRRLGPYQTKLECKTCRIVLRAFGYSGFKTVWRLGPPPVKTRSGR